MDGISVLTPGLSRLGTQRRWGNALQLPEGAVVMATSHCLLPRQQQPKAGALGAWLWLCWLRRHAVGSRVEASGKSWWL